MTTAASLVVFPVLAGAVGVWRPPRPRQFFVGFLALFVLESLR
ncbi:MAG: hypothetical protein VYB90_03940 [Actinomycetota bacterium]|nr:hypothetical protein [Actinomycetota bacterium]